MKLLKNAKKTQPPKETPPAIVDTKEETPIDIIVPSIENPATAVNSEIDDSSERNPDTFDELSSQIEALSDSDFNQQGLASIDVKTVSADLLDGSTESVDLLDGSTEAVVELGDARAKVGRRVFSIVEAIRSVAGINALHNDVHKNATEEKVQQDWTACEKVDSQAAFDSFSRLRKEAEEWGRLASALEDECFHGADSSKVISTLQQVYSLKEIEVCHNMESLMGALVGDPHYEYTINDRSD